MRISISLAGGQLSPPTNTMVQTLAKLLAEHDVLPGLVRRVTPSSVWVRISEKDIELPLKGYPLTSGQVVEISRDGQTITLKTLIGQSASHGEAEQKALTPTQLGEVLVELNIPPTTEAVRVAEGLVERGFPLQEALVWSLLPWAEEGQLEEAFLALQAKYPLKQEVLAVAGRLKERHVGEPILTAAREDLPSDLKELFFKPNLGNRTNWHKRFPEGKVFKALARLLVEERLAESLLNREMSPHHEYLLAIPFLRKDDLYASWVRITRDDPDVGADGEEHNSFRLELEIPTATLGVVGAELFVAGRSVAINLRVEEGSNDLQLALEDLRQELHASGWNLRELQVRGWDDAQSGSITI